MEKEVFLIPEIHNKNPFFIARNAEKVTIQPIPVKGFKLFADSTKLDTYASDFCVITIPAENKHCKLFPVRFSAGAPDFEKYGFKLKKLPQGTIVYMDSSDFWNYNINNRCIPIKGGDWCSLKRHFKMIAALYHLFIIPTMCKTAFKQTETMSKYEEELKDYFNQDKPLLEALSSVFRNTLMSLEFFGFCNDITNEQRDLFNHVKARCKNNKVVIAFGQIEFLIKKYNEKCYNIKGERGAKLPGYAYLQLMNSLHLVETYLRQLGYKIDDYDYVALKTAIKDFQKNKGLEITGICDSKTLVGLWEITVAYSSNVDGMLVNIGNRMHPKQEKKILIASEPNDTENQVLLAEHINRVIGDIPMFTSAEEYLRCSIKGKLYSLTQRCGTLNQRVENISKRMSTARDIMEMINSKDENLQQKLNTASSLLDRVVSDHGKIQQQFVQIRDNIVSQRKKNRFLQVLSLIIFIIYVYRFIHNH